MSSNNLGLPHDPFYYGGRWVVADYPVFPIDIGWESAIKTLGNFPLDTAFHQLSDVDGCFLLIARHPSIKENTKNPYEESNYHIAVWDEDLEYLHSKGYISGVELITEYEQELKVYEQCKDFYDERGNKIYPSPPDLEEYDNDYSYIVSIDSTNGINLMEAGIQALFALAIQIKFAENLEHDVIRLFSASFYDDAVRRACILVEEKLKQIVGEKDLYGQKLIDSFFKLS